MKKRVFWVNIILVFALIVGLVMPVDHVNAATKNKKDSPKILIVYFSGTGTTKSAAEKIKKATGGKRKGFNRFVIQKCEKMGKEANKISVFLEVNICRRSVKSSAQY